MTEQTLTSGNWLAAIDPSAKLQNSALETGVISDYLASARSLRDWSHSWCDVRSKPRDATAEKAGASRSVLLL